MFIGIFAVVFIFVMGFIVMNAIKTSKNKTPEDEEKLKRKIQDLKEKFDLTDEEVEAVERQALKKFDKNEQKHDEYCEENDCDGCGTQDVYDQVYGKRKKNKLKNKK